MFSDTHTSLEAIAASALIIFFHIVPSLLMILRMLGGNKDVDQYFHSWKTITNAGAAIGFNKLYVYI